MTTMPRPAFARARRLPGAALILAALLGASSCGREASQERIVLPSTPILSIRTSWAVVRSPLLKIREEASSKAAVLQYMRTGAIVEVIARSDAEDTVEDEKAYWYRINYDGVKGWVFGAYLEVFDSRARAEAAAAGLP